MENLVYQTADHGRWTTDHCPLSVVYRPIKKNPRSKTPRGFTHHATRSMILLFLLGFHFLLVRFDDRASDMRRDRIVVIEVHRKVTAATCNGAELGCVA